MFKIFLTVGICLILAGINFATVYAYEINTSPTYFNPNQIFNGLPGPLTDFINSAKQMGQNVIIKTTKTSLNSSTPRNIFESADNWFQSVTGISLLGFIKALGNIIVWILEWILKIFKWLLLHV